MTLPTRLLATLGISSALMLAGCSGENPAATAAKTPAAVSDVAANTGGSCEATVGEAPVPDPSASPDAVASKDALSAVTLSGDAAVAPTVTFEAPLAITSEVVEVADKGAGEVLADGQIVTFNFLVCDIATGQKMHSTWGTTPEANAPESYILSESNFGPTLTAALDGASVGTRVLWGQPGLSAEQSFTGEAVNGFLYVLTVTGTQKVLDAATGATVTPTDPSLPTVTFADGTPTVSVPPSFASPAELVVQPLIQGEGATVEAGQSVTVKYTGWLTDGTQFDSSWHREAPNDVLAFTAGAGEVIPGWDQGVVGQKVGSRLLLVIPSGLAYGDKANGEIPPNSTLIFVVDILAAL